MYCTNCGNPVSENAKFCPNCGAVLSQDPQPASAPQPQSETPLQGQTSAPQPVVPPQEAAAPVANQPQQTYAAPMQTAAPEPAPTYQGTSYPAAQPSGQPIAPSAYPSVAPAMYGAQPAYAGTATYAPPAPKKKTGLIVAICAGGVVVIAAIVLLILWLTGVFGGANSSPRAVAERYVSALTQSDGVNGQALLDLMPDRLVQELISEGEYSNEAELADYMESVTGSISEGLAYIESYGVSYEFNVGEGTPVSNSTLSDIQDAYQEYDMNVTAAQDVEINFTYSLGEHQESETESIPVVQINGSWYLDVYSL